MSADHFIVFFIEGNPTRLNLSFFCNTYAYIGAYSTTVSETNRGKKKNCILVVFLNVLVFISANCDKLCLCVYICILIYIGT